MKNKILVASFAAALFGSVVAFAADTDVVAKKPVLKKHTSSLSARTSELEKQVRELKSQIVKTRDIKTPVELYAHGPAVVTSPAFGLRYSDFANDNELMVNLSGINKDLYLIKLRQKMDNYAVENNLIVPSGPIIVLSGGVEGQIIYNKNDNYTNNAKTDINLSRAELDVVGEVGPWVTAAMLITYDDAAGTGTSTGSVTQASNSRLKIDRAWLTVGQLNKSPLYFTLGQVYAPFGTYDSFMVTTPSTRTLGRMKDRMLVLGYCQSFNQDQHLAYAQVFGFSGEAKTAFSSDAANATNLTKIIKHSGFDLGYRYERDHFKVHVGGGILGNLAESEGMQLIYGTATAAELLSSNNVYGYNGHIKFDIYDFDVLAEYVGASKAFKSTDLSFNGSGAQPQALNIEGAYSFKFLEKRNTVFVGYGMTSQALALGLPKASYFTGYSIAPIKNTLASIEYRHNVNYQWSDTAGAIAGATSSSITTSVTGRHSNSVTMQLGVYF